MKQKLVNLIDNTETFHGKTFTFAIQALIVISLITFSIETLPDLSNDTKRLLRSIEIFTVLLFTFEYILRLITANKKLNFVFSFYGLIDLAAILPFYIATGLDLRAVRIFRLLRLFRILKLVRYSNQWGQTRLIIDFSLAMLLLFSKSVYFSWLLDNLRVITTYRFLKKLTKPA